MRQAGFTLVELLFTIVIASIMALSSGYLLENTVDQYAEQSASWEQLHQARRVLQRMHQDLQLLGTADIQSLSSNRIEFTDQSGANTSLRFENNTLYRGNDLLAENINSFSLTAYDANHNATTSPSSIQALELTMGIARPEGSTETYRQLIIPRNTYYDTYQ